MNQVYLGDWMRGTTIYYSRKQVREKLCRCASFTRRLYGGIFAVHKTSTLFYSCLCLLSIDIFKTSIEIKSELRSSTTCSILMSWGKHCSKLWDSYFQGHKLFLNLHFQSYALAIVVTCKGVFNDNKVDSPKRKKKVIEQVSNPQQLQWIWINQ